MEEQKNTTVEIPIPTPPEIPTAPVEQKPIIHTYESDFALAMDTTDASTVQVLLQTARDQELSEKERIVIQRQRGWYTTAAVILIILALGAGAYSIYYYRNLTVPVTPNVSVGVFPSTLPIVVTTTNITDGITRLTTTEPLPEGKALLVPIVTDQETLTPLTTEQVLQFMNIPASEPFMAALSLVRLGVLNTGTSVSPFLLFSTPNPEIASKEFLIAEPKLLALVAPVLNIDQKNESSEIGTGFTSTYMYNLPVRTLHTTNLDTKEETILLYYGYATDHTIVVATNPTVLKTVYDTIIRQR
jgi:hypothetical protein